MAAATAAAVGSRIQKLAKIKLTAKKPISEIINTFFFIY